MTQRDKDTDPTAKIRADVLLVERGLAATRAKAQALLLAGQVYCNERRLEKPGQLLLRSTPLRVLEGERYVSRGGYKLEGALEALSITVQGDVCADVGASTGGFTDCLLQRGAVKIYAIDVGHGQLASRLREDPRVVVMDRTNARHLEPEVFAEPLDLVVVDASFIGIEKLLPALAKIIPVGRRLLAMIKPQFEAGRREAARGKGVISDPVLRRELLDRARASVIAHGFEILGSCDSVLAGPKGNLEHFLFARRAS